MKPLFTLSFYLFTLPIFAQCYQLVWADEFAGSSLDRSKWTVVTGEGGAVSGNAELQYYLDRSENIQVSNGSLKIIALNDGHASNAYTSARMQSKFQGDWLYGKIEGRIKLPVAQGMWPAFWMMPTDSHYGIWPKSGEMDIMELIGREPSNAYGTIHTHENGTLRSFGTHYTLPSGTFADDFHVFSMEWSPNLIKIYVDGILYMTQTPASISPAAWVYDKRFFILLNLAIGGPWAGAPNGTTTFPQTMEVDYVRVYQKTEQIAITGKKLIEPNTPSVNYSVPSMAGVTYNWSVSGSGNSIASGQGTAAIAVNWATTSGTVSCVINDGCSAAATAATPVTVSANLWDNFGFEQDFVNWDTRPAYNSAAAVFNVNNSDFTEGGKSAQVQVVSVQTNPWNIQLSRINLDLLAGTSYTLRFKAKSDANRTIPISFIHSTAFWSVGARTINLTTNWQTFTLTFTPTVNVNAMFNADLAAATGLYYFDDFTFSRTALLPLDLTAFKGKNTEGGNLLSWATAEEKNTRDFEIERSADGQIFETIGTVKSKGSDAHYEFLDTRRDIRPYVSTASTNYYRLKINDLDEKFEYSKIISIERKGATKVKIYPSVTNGFLTIENARSFEIVNAVGQVMLRETAAQSSGNFQSFPNLTHFPSGIYFIKGVDTEGGIFSQKIIKQ